MAEFLELAWFIFDRSFWWRHLWEPYSIVRILHRTRRRFTTGTVRHTVAGSFVTWGDIRWFFRGLCCDYCLPRGFEEDWFPTSVVFAFVDTIVGGFSALSLGHLSPFSPISPDSRSYQRLLLRSETDLPPVESFSDAQHGGAGDGIVLEGIECAVGFRERKDLYVRSNWNFGGKA